MEKDDTNAYEPPAAQLVKSEPETDRLYTPAQIAGGTFFGTLAAPIWMLAANYRQLGRPDAAWRTWAIGMAVMTAFLTTVTLLPLSVPGLVIGIVQVIVVLPIARTLQGAAIDNHFQNGGGHYSNWRVAGISLLAAALVLGALFLLFSAVYMTVPDNWATAIDRALPEG